MELPLILNLYLISACELILLGVGVIGFLVLEVAGIDAISLIFEEILPVEIIDEDMNFVGDLIMDVIVMNPIHHDLKTASSDLHTPQHLEGDVGIDEGIEEDVCILLLAGQDDLVNLSKFLESPCDILRIQLCFFKIRCAVRIWSIKGNGYANDGKIIPITKSFISQLILQMCDKNTVIKQFLNPRLVCLLNEVGDLTIIVDLYRQGGTIEKTDENSLFTVDLLLS